MTDTPRGAPSNHKTHDYTKRYWGHDYTFTPFNGGLTGRAMGWGHGIREGDTLHLRHPHNRDGVAAYRVDRIEYQMDPPDMWAADLTFTPRANDD